MAVNKIHIIRDNLQGSLTYIANPEKTEGGTLVAGMNCSPFSAYADMLETQRQFGKDRGRLAYHLVQSFEPGEVTAEQAMNIGQMFADRYLMNRYEALLAVHTDHDHLHCHLIWNAASYVDGKKYHAQRGQYLDGIRALSDQICRDQGLSVINPSEEEKHATKGQHYAAWKAEQENKPSRRSLLQGDIDQILTDPRVITLTQFDAELKERGYEIKHGKHLAVRLPGQERFLRIKSIGPGYSEEEIRQKLITKGRHMPAFSQPSSQKAGRKPGQAVQRRPPTRHNGFMATYWWYVYRIYQVRQQPRNRKVSPLMRAEIFKLEAMISDFRLIVRENIENLVQLQEYGSTVAGEIKDLVHQRQLLNKQERQNLGASPELAVQIRSIGQQIKTKRKELRQLDRIEQKSTEITGQLQAVDQAEKESGQPCRRTIPTQKGR